MAARKKKPVKKAAKKKATKKKAVKKAAKKKTAKKKAAKKTPVKTTPATDLDLTISEAEIRQAQPTPLATLVENQAILFDEVRDVRVRLEQLEDLLLLEINDLAKKIQDFSISFWEEMNVIRGALGVPAEDEAEGEDPAL